MSVSHFIAIRYLKTSRDNRFFSWISLLSILGLGIGVAALIVVLSVINGFEYQLRERFLMANAHIMAYRYPMGMGDWQKWSRIIEKDFPKEVKGTSPFIHYETMLKHNTYMHGVLVRGIAPQLRERVQSLEGLVEPAQALMQLEEEVKLAQAGKALPKPPGIILGTGLLGLIDAKIGETVMLVAPSEESYTDMQEFRILGTYNSGLKHYDNRLVAMSLPAARAFFKMGDVVTGLEIGLYDADDSIKVAQQMDRKYNLTFREWQSFNSPLFEAMEKERFVIALIVAMVVLVAGFNILTTVFVAVSQKQKDISILKSLGATNKQIVRLFINQGVYIGVIGSLFGVILAFVISKLLEKYPFIDLPEPYFLKHLPVHYSPTVYAVICASAILICVAAGLYPSLIAARVKPTDGFREIGDALK